MVDSSFNVAAFCICASVFSVVLKQYCSEQSLLISLAACIGVIGAAMYYLAPAFSEIQNIFVDSGISESYISIIFKAASLSVITQITCDICRDSGENSIASAAELWGRCAVTFISIPIIKALLELINSII